MPKTTRAHRVIQHAVIDGFVPPEGSPIPPGRRRDSLEFSLTDGRMRIQTARVTADTFHLYDFTARDGVPMHTAYARHLPHSTKKPNGHSAAHLDITYIYEVTADAVAAAFGLHTT